LTATQSAVDTDDGDDGQTTKRMSVDEEFRSAGVKDGQRDVITLTFSGDVIAGTRPVTSHKSTSPGQHFTSCVPPHADSDARLMLQPPPPPPSFLAPPPYPYHLCPSPYVTSFPPPLYPVRPRPLMPMTHFRAPPFDGCRGFQAGAASSRTCTGFMEVDVARRRLLGVGTSPWRPGVGDAPRTSSLDVDQVQASMKSLTNCCDVEELETTDSSDCDQIDVDTVDDSTPTADVSAATAVDGLNSSLGMT